MRIRIGNLSVLKFIKTLIGLRLIDPIEVYYLKEKNLFYPIVSKSGCSTIKQDIIRIYKPSFCSKFPEIHQVNPSLETNGKVIRKYFYSKKKYNSFCKGKNMCLVIRNPFERVYSCFLDISKNKNTMYEDPSGLTNFFGYNQSITFNKFISKVVITPDRLSDRHFRSQSFYINIPKKNDYSKINIVLLETYSKSAVGSSKLNTNNNIIPLELIEALKNNKRFLKRFKTDLKLYENSSLK